MQQDVTFLGYRLDKHGIHPLADKIAAIRDAPTPRNTQELRSFVEIVIVCDASPIGVGAILSQVDGKGDEKPVVYASRTLQDAERKYSQIDREGLAIIFAVKKFHKYISARFFKLITDHKPLLGLLGEDKVISEHASARVQRWAIILSAYSYSLLHRPGRDNSADAFSRLPLPYSPDSSDVGIDCVPESVNLLFSLLDKSVLSAKDIALETQKDKTLRQVYLWVVSGWPAKTEEHFRAFSARKNELSVENGCLLWGTRVVIPQTLETRVLELLHGETHV
ncbi:transposon Tf2-11 polyprotein, partial [Elysia marginata]